MTTSSRRKRTRSDQDAPAAARPARAASSMEIEDDQLIEVAELGPRPRASVAFHDVGSEHVAVARATIETLGHRLVTAGAGKAAVARIIQILRDERAPDVVVLGLPEGEAIIDAARALEPRRPVLIAVLGGAAPLAADRAHAAGADLVTLRPHDSDHLGPVLMAASALASERVRRLTLQGTEAMLRGQLARAGESHTSTGFQTVEMFKRTLEVELKRARRYGYALSVCQLGMVPPSTAPPPAIAHELRVRAATAIAEAIRDIDFPVEIGDDRFLVLLPYTDTAGAALVGRRVIAAVRAAPPVRGAGKAWTPAVAAGVAGVLAGAPVSMAQLMRDAGEALRAARRHGVELEIAP